MKSRFGPKKKSLMLMTDEQLAAYHELLKDKRISLEQVRAHVEKELGISLSRTAIHEERKDVIEAAEIISNTGENSAEILKLLGANPEQQTADTLKVAQQLISVTLYKTARALANGESVDPQDAQRMARALLDVNNSLGKTISNDQLIAEREKARAELLKSQSQKLEKDRADGVLTKDEYLKFRQFLGIAK